MLTLGPFASLLRRPDDKFQAGGLAKRNAGRWVRRRSFAV